MCLLFDENTPFTLASELIGHECSSVYRPALARNGKRPQKLALSDP
jgi:hypothetical protein